MQINYKAIIHERAEDAPFMGALIVGTQCSNNCKDCFNQHLKEARTLRNSIDSIIGQVRQNPFNDGIILGGLEWSEQPEETISLIHIAKMAGLQVMLYTGLTEDELQRRIPLWHLNGCWVKYGPYNSNAASNTYYSHGIKLASTNQYVTKY